MIRALLIAPFLFVWSFAVAQGQDSTAERSVTFSDALQIALEKNHDLIIARNDEEISRNNASLGNAGLLPQLGVSGSYTKSKEDAEVVFTGNSIPPQNINGALSETLSGSISASYTLFDGLGNYYRFKSLQKLDEQAGVQTRLEIESTLLNVIRLYLNAVSSKEAIRINRESVMRSQERLNRVQNRYKFGNATRLDLLNAEVALNADSVIMIQGVNELANAKRDLLLEIGLEPESDISITNEFGLNSDLVATELLNQALQNNASLIISRLSAENADLAIKQARSDIYPVIDLNGSYNYNRVEREAGQLEFQRSNGFTGGISVRLNLFNGGQNSIRIQNAQIELKNSLEAQQFTQKSLRRDVLNLYENYQTDLFLLRKEEVNLKTAELNFERSSELLDLGQITNTEYREAQLQVARIESNIINLKVRAKISEISLLQLSGDLIQVASNTD